MSNSGIQGKKFDSGGAFDDSKLTGFGRFGPSEKAFDWIAAGGGLLRDLHMGGDYSALVSSLRWHCIIL
jgi:hypothetical protein